MNGICEIILPSGEVVTIDEADAPAVKAKAWSFQSGYAMHYWRSGGRTRSISMHRFLMGATSGDVVDHRDGDPLNNTRANLRICTPDQNQKNRRKPKNNTSGLKGVTLKHNRWIATITSDGRRVDLGCFESRYDAALAYDEAAKRLHGEFARLNFDPKRDWLLPHSTKRRGVGRPRCEAAE